MTVHRSGGFAASLLIGVALATITACGASGDGAPPAPSDPASSSGPAATSGASGATGLISVPNESGRDAATAVAQLRQVGFAHVGLTTPGKHGEAVTDPPAWQVTATEPAAGATVPSDSPVTVEVIRK